jgi:hypothetical protein
MMTDTGRSEKEEDARRTLPDELKPVFDDIVADYRYVATVRHGKPYISYIVLADMDRAGWRRMADPVGVAKPSNS